MFLKKNWIIILFIIFIYILYYSNEAKHHPNTGGKTKINFLAIELALCQISKKNLPKNLTELIDNQIFRQEVISFLMKNGYKFVSFEHLMRVDEWDKVFEYQKTDRCKAILHSSGEDTIRNTQDDILYTIDCYCF